VGGGLRHLAARAAAHRRRRRAGQGVLRPALAQVDLGVRKHRHRSLRALGVTASEVLDAALRRCLPPGARDAAGDVLTRFVPLGGEWVPDEHDVATADRPPIRELLHR